VLECPLGLLRRWVRQLLVPSAQDEEQSEEILNSQLARVCHRHQNRCKSISARAAIITPESVTATAATAGA
jgi:hypothetical protein